MPRKECRGDSSCREVYDSPDSANLSRPIPYKTKPIHILIRSNHNDVKNTTQSLGPCQSLDEMSDNGGSWVLDPSVMLDLNQSSPTLVMPPNNGGWTAAWVPHKCKLKLFKPSELQQVFEGKHFLIIGDSVTHMFMAAMMHLILGNQEFRYPTNGPDLCGHNNRVYDSGDMMFPIRFSFLWVGSAHYCGNNEGLPSTLRDEYGFARFKRGLGKDVDFVVVNAGAHDIAGNVALDDYE